MTKRSCVGCDFGHPIATDGIHFDDIECRYPFPNCVENAPEGDRSQYCPLENGDEDDEE